MPKKDYTNWDRKDLIKEIEQLRKRKKYGLVWEEKPEVVVEQCKNELPILEEVKDKEISTDPDKPTNLLIEGDNYHALSVLNYTHKGKIDVIYIDPPYNTGKKDFKYNDSYVDKEDPYKHSKWLSFMKKRLETVKSLLSSHGVIIVHIDEHEIDTLYLLMTEIFDEKNDLGRVIWNKKNPKGDSRGVSIMHESILCFAKNKEIFLQLSNVMSKKKSNAEKMLSKANKLWKKLGKKDIPEDVRAVLKSLDFTDEILEKLEVDYNLEFINKEYQSWLKRQDFSSGEKAYRFIDESGDVYRGVSMAWPNKKKAPDNYFKPLTHPVTGKSCPVPSRGWRNPPETMEKLLEEKMVLFGEDERKQPERKYLLKENLLENTPSIFSYGGSDDKLFEMLDIRFPYAKPVEVAKYLIQAIHPSPRIVLDHFAGSGTTGHAVIAINEEQNKKIKFILCTNNEENIIADVCYPRLDRIINGYKELKSLGGNLKYFRTGFVPADPTDKNKVALTKKATEMLCVKEDTFDEVKSIDKYQIFRNKKKHTGIIFDHLAIPEFKDEIKDIDGKFSVYVFSLGDDTFDEEFEDIENKVKLSPIPEAILRVYRRIFK